MNDYFLENNTLPMIQHEKSFVNEVDCDDPSEAVGTLICQISIVASAFKSVTERFTA